MDTQNHYLAGSDHHLSLHHIGRNNPANPAGAVGASRRLGLTSSAPLPYNDLSTGLLIACASRMSSSSSLMYLRVISSPACPIISASLMMSTPFRSDSTANARLKSWTPGAFTPAFPARLRMIFTRPWYLIRSPSSVRNSAPGVY